MKQSILFSKLILFFIIIFCQPIHLIQAQNNNESYINEEKSPEIINPKDDDPVSDHIALLLPFADKDLASNADIIHKGFVQGYEIASKNTHNPNWKPLPITIYSTTNDSDHIFKTYLGAIQAGAKLIVGPITRSGSNKINEYILEKKINKPMILMLNNPENNQNFNSNDYNLTYYFPFDLDQESRQIAQLAYREGKRRAILVHYNSSLNKKMIDNFASEFQSLGGQIINKFVVTTDTNSFPQLRKFLADHKKNNPDIVFFSADSEKAKFIKPFFDEFKLNVYSTNQLFSTQNNQSNEFNQVKFSIMPYFDSQNEDAKLINKNQYNTLDNIRFYSFGYDAGKASQLLLDFAPLASGFEFEGLTGKMILDNKNKFQRQLIPVMYSKGNLTPWNPDKISPSDVLKVTPKAIPKKPKTEINKSVLPTVSTGTTKLIAKPLPKPKKPILE